MFETELKNNCILQFIYKYLFCRVSIITDLEKLRPYSLNHNITFIVGFCEDAGEYFTGHDL